METTTNEQLVDGLTQLIRKDRHHVVLMLRYIAEIDERKAWAAQACSSMFAFLVQRFHMSEEEVYARIGAARAARRFPEIFDMVERGELHLTAVALLRAHLTPENHGQVLARAKHKTKRQVLELIAGLAPKPDKSTTIRAVSMRKAPAEDVYVTRADDTESLQLLPACQQELVRRSRHLRPRDFIFP